MRELLSEQKPNDGGYYPKQWVKKANKGLKQEGKQGKRATIVIKGSSLSLQFTFKDGNGNNQKNVGLGAIPLSQKGVLEAERIARLVTHQLEAGTFTWDWYYALIGKDTSEKTQVLTCKQMIEEYKKHFFKQREGNKTPKASWYNECRHLENVLSETDKPLSRFLIKSVIDLTKNNTRCRKRLFNGLASFLSFYGIEEYKKDIEGYKANNNIKCKPRNVPDSKRIIEVYNDGFTPKPTTNKKWLYRYPQWRFLYGLLATYGLRIHEAWLITNWDKPVTLKDGDWVTVDIDFENSISIQRDAGNLTIPAILDPKNKDHVLCIGAGGKTGYRMAIPMSPEGRNWIKEFNLLQPLNLPDVPNPLGRKGNDEGCYNCSGATAHWFGRRGYGFTAHDLRHAWNHRGHHLGYNPKVLSDSLGHSIQINGNNYLRHMSDSVKLEGMIEAISKNTKTRSKVETLEAENKALKTENMALKNENELLKTKLKMYEAIAESEGQK